MVATANGIAAAAIIHSNQPNYPDKLVPIQVLIVLAALLIASRNRVIEAVGLLATVLGILFTLSGMFLYAPTFIAVIWGMVSQGKARMARQEATARHD